MSETPADQAEPQERPYEEAKASQEDIDAAEDRQPDQIADYHETHPTLEVEEPAESEEELNPPAEEPAEE